MLILYFYSLQKITTEYSLFFCVCVSACLSLCVSVSVCLSCLSQCHVQVVEENEVSTGREGVLHGIFRKRCVDLLKTWKLI